MAIDDSLERARLHPDVLKNLAKNKKLKVSEAYSEDNPPPYPVTSVAGKTGAVDLLPSDVGLGNVDNVQQYSADNPPPPSVLYFYQQSVSAASNAEIMRITDSNITTDTVVLECTFADSGAIASDVTWTSYSGYIAFTGTCTAATTANVALGKTN